MLAGTLGACEAATHVSETVETSTGADYRQNFSAARMKAHVEFLADDALKGRNTGSPEYVIAANYVATEFKRLGLKPAGENGSFFQEVPFARYALDIDQSFVSLTKDGESNALEAGEDYFLPANVFDLAAEASGEMVFVGYGIHAPQIDVDDLEDLDLKGKIVVFFRGGPKDMNSEIRAHFNRAGNKIPEMLARGAKGFIQLQSVSRQESWKKDRMVSFMKEGSMTWVREDDDALVKTKGALLAVVTHDVARRMFEGAEKTFDDVLADYEEGTLSGFPLKASLAMKRTSFVKERFTSPNVLAVLEGSDRRLAGEYVVASGHLDHVGVDEDAEGDDHIFNGAMDNATGIATMLEVAENLTRNGVQPKRSILFAAVTAEEKGLLGAEYFAHFPTVPQKSMVANVNLDMPVLLYNFADVIAFGANRSSLGPITEKATAKAGVALTPDPLPEEGLFVRSDHYRFVQKGIPAVFLMTGFAETEDGENGGEIFKEFLGTKYHSPKDEPSLPIRYDAGAKFAYVNYLILSEIANNREKPKWNEGDFFGNLFSK